MRTRPHTALAFDWHALKTEAAYALHIAREKAYDTLPLIDRSSVATIATITRRLK